MTEQDYAAKVQALTEALERIAHLPPKGPFVYPSDELVEAQEIARAALDADAPAEPRCDFDCDACRAEDAAPEPRSAEPECLCEGEFPAYCGPECRCHHHEPTKGEPR